MAVLHGRDLLSSKYITAEIKDASKRLHYVPIKHTIGEYFLADIEGQVYCFKIDNEICQYRPKLTKSFRIIQYDTTHYRPVKSDVKELELALTKNSLPRVDGMLANIFKALGSKEKKEFTPHSLVEMIKEINEHSKTKNGEIIAKSQDYRQRVENIITYLNSLGVDNIVTPVRGISEFIEDDLRATDPKFLGTVATTLQNLDYENKKVTNTPVKSSMAWIKWALMFMIIFVIAFAIYWMYEEGYFDSFLAIGEGFQGIQLPAPGIPQSPGVKDSQYYMDNYTPESLRAAVDRGEIQLEDLPPDVIAMIENVEPSQAVPIP